MAKSCQWRKAASILLAEQDPAWKAGVGYCQRSQAVCWSSCLWFDFQMCCNRWQSAGLPLDRWRWRSRCPWRIAQEWQKIILIPILQLKKKILFDWFIKYGWFSSSLSFLIFFWGFKKCTWGQNPSGFLVVEENTCNYLLHRKVLLELFSDENV